MFKSGNRKKARDGNVHSAKLQLIVRIQPSDINQKEELLEKVQGMKITGVSWNYSWNESSNICIRAIIEDEKVSQDQVEDRIKDNYGESIDKLALEVKPLHNLIVFEIKPWD